MSLFDVTECRLVARNWDTVSGLQSLDVHHVVRLSLALDRVIEHEEWVRDNPPKGNR